MFWWVWSGGCGGLTTRVQGLHGHVRQNAGKSAQEGTTSVLTSRRDHAGGQRVRENTSQVVDEAADHNSLVPETAGRCLGDNGVARRTDCDHVDQGGKDKQYTNAHLSLFRVDAAEATNDKEEDEHDTQANHIDGCTTEVREQSPADEATNNVAC